MKCNILKMIWYTKRNTLYLQVFFFSLVLKTSHGKSNKPFETKRVPLNRNYWFRVREQCGLTLIGCFHLEKWIIYYFQFNRFHLSANREKLFCFFSSLRWHRSYHFLFSVIDHKFPFHINLFISLPSAFFLFILSIFIFLSFFYFVFPDFHYLIARHKCIFKISSTSFRCLCV